MFTFQLGRNEFFFRPRKCEEVRTVKDSFPERVWRKKRGRGKRRRREEERKGEGEARRDSSDTTTADDNNNSSSSSSSSNKADEGSRSFNGSWSASRERQMRSTSGHERERGEKKAGIFLLSTDRTRRFRLERTSSALVRTYTRVLHTPSRVSHA